MLSETQRIDGGADTAALEELRNHLDDTKSVLDILDVLRAHVDQVVASMEQHGDAGLAIETNWTPVPRVTKSRHNPQANK